MFLQTISLSCKHILNSIHKNKKYEKFINIFIIRTCTFIFMIFIRLSIISIKKNINHFQIDVFLFY